MLARGRDRLLMPTLNYRQAAWLVPPRFEVVSLPAVFIVGNGKNVFTRTDSPRSNALLCHSERKGFNLRSFPIVVMGPWPL